MMKGGAGLMKRIAKQSSSSPTAGTEGTRARVPPTILIVWGSLMAGVVAWLLATTLKLQRHVIMLEGLIASGKPGPALGETSPSSNRHPPRASARAQGASLAAGLARLDPRQNVQQRRAVPPRAAPPVAHVPDDEDLADVDDAATDATGDDVPRVEDVTEKMSADAASDDDDDDDDENDEGMPPRR